MLRADIGVCAVVEARDVARETPPAAAAVPAPAAIAAAALGYGGGAVAVESGLGNGSVDREVVIPAAMGTVDGGWACDTASRYGGATSSSSPMLAILGLALWFCLLGLLALRWLWASREARLLLDEKRPPMRSSASKEKTRRWRDHFFGVLGRRFSEMGAAAQAPVRCCRRLRRRRQRKARAKMRRVPTTTGTAMAACRPGLHDMLLQEF